MPAPWEKEFGSQHLITLENDTRPYFALEKMESRWEKQAYYSRTNLWWKRTELFFDGDTIRKVIEEEKQVRTNGEIYRQSYREYDTCLQTQERKLLLPLTKRGKPKPLTASAVGNTTEKIAAIQNDSDFQKFAKWYIATCPDDYFAKVERVKNSTHQTVKYRTGDIFRVEYDRFSYCYGLVTGEIRKILRWEELPDSHSFHMLMTVPVMVRFYEVMTPNASMTPEELSQYPLGRVELCADNDLLWGTHPIVGHRRLAADDVEFPLVCSRVSGDFFPEEESACDLYVEWGTAQVVLPASSLSPVLQDWLKGYFCPWGGVQLGIFPDLVGLREEEKLRLDTYRNNLQISQNREIREELFCCLGLPDDADFDDFAISFGGLTMEEIVKKLNAG